MDGKFGALPGETVIEQRQGDADWSRARRMWRISRASSRRGDIALRICFTQFRTENRCSLFQEVLTFPGMARGTINHGVQQSLGVASLPL
ncbi:MAG: hypothetical protein E5V74_26110 [Mesorhizobium sp.]|nr:MAG: hypothetical protein E5V74_26110 [Mesorhizobium sp.]